MKVLIVALLLLTVTTPVLAGYKPSKVGGPSSSRGGGGTRVLAPLSEQTKFVPASRVILGVLLLRQ